MSEPRPLGRVALHGGGEFLKGDERFLGKLLETVRGDLGRGTPDAPIRVSILPVAAARSRPSAAVAVGRAAFERVAKVAGIALMITAAMVVDAASAADTAMASGVASSDLIYLPGGDPDLVGGVLAGSPAWDAIRAAFEVGAVVAGASAGAMGLANRTWTRFGFRDGLGFTDGFVVVPHFAGFDRRGWEGTVEELRRNSLGQLGIDERTGVISSRGGVGPWVVAGDGAVHWFPAAGAPASARDGEWLDLGA